MTSLTVKDFEDPKTDKDQHEEEDDDHFAPEPWKEVFLLGTEFERLADVHNFGWKFGTLDEALATGVLSAGDPEHGAVPVYLFGLTEGQSLRLANGSDTVVLVPAMVAVRTKEPPPLQLGVTSVVKGEKIEEMKKFKLDWVPLIGRQDINRATKKRKSKERTVFRLACTQRQAALPQLTEEQRKNWEYCLPYVTGRVKPTKMAVAMLELNIQGRGVQYPFDFSADTPEDVAEELTEDHNMEEEEVKKLAAEIKEKVTAAKAQIDADFAKAKQEYEEGKKKWEAAGLKIYKFYPSNSKPDLSAHKPTYINRYYGHADQVF